MLVLSFTVPPAILVVLALVVLALVVLALVGLALVELALVGLALVGFGDDCSVVTPPNMFHKLLVFR